MQLVNDSLATIFSMINQHYSVRNVHILTELCSHLQAFPNGTISIRPYKKPAPSPKENEEATLSSQEEKNETKEFITRKGRAHHHALKVCPFCTEGVTNITKDITYRYVKRGALHKHIKSAHYLAYMDICRPFIPNQQVCRRKEKRAGIVCLFHAQSTIN